MDFLRNSALDFIKRGGGVNERVAAQRVAAEVTRL